jgi:hypothetical protein
MPVRSITVSEIERWKIARGAVVAPRTFTPSGDAKTECKKDRLYREMDRVREQFRAVANCWLAPFFGAPVSAGQYVRSSRAPNATTTRPNSIPRLPANHLKISQRRASRGRTSKAPPGTLALVLVIAIECVANRTITITIILLRASPMARRNGGLVPRFRCCSLQRAGSRSRPPAWTCFRCLRTAGCLLRLKVAIGVCESRCFAQLELCEVIVHHTQKVSSHLRQRSFSNVSFM